MAMIQIQTVSSKMSVFRCSPGISRDIYFKAPNDSVLQKGSASFNMTPVPPAKPKNFLMTFYYQLAIKKNHRWPDCFVFGWVVIENSVVR